MLYFSFLDIRKLEEFGFLLFIIGIFLLCSSLFLSLLFLLPSLLIGTIIQIKKKNFFKDNFNISFLLCGIIILSNAFLQRFFLTNNFQEIWSSDLTIIGLGNWIPFFWMFWAFQPFLNSSIKRKKFVYSIVSGTFPLLLTGFGQYFFNLTGPYETLNSLIIWYQRPISPPGGLSGLFSNQNYAGTWLNFIWPFCIALIFEKSQNLINRSFAICFLVSVGLATFLTYSRNAWTGLLVAIPILIGQESLFWVILFLFIGTVLIIYYLKPILSYDISNLIKGILPEKIILEFTKEGYEGLDATRLEILRSALEIIKIRPLIGIGAASFTAIYYLETTFYKGHSHNLITELAISYGVPVTIIFFATIMILLIKSGYIIFFNDFEDNNNKFIDRAFWSAIFFFFLSQLADIQYFDGKISIVAWTLLGGLKNIIKDNIKTKKL